MSVKVEITRTSPDARGRFGWKVVTEWGGRLYLSAEEAEELRANLNRILPDYLAEEKSA